MYYPVLLRSEMRRMRFCLDGYEIGEIKTHTFLPFVRPILAAKALVSG